MMNQLLKLSLTTSLLVGYCFTSWAQDNLVPNFGFEQYSNCPNTEDQVQYCEGWSKYSSTISTPDYYNSCVADNGWGDVPENTGFYQLDNRNCGAYMGLVTWVHNISNYSESIGIQLNQPLVLGEKYFVSFYTVMALKDDYTTPSSGLGMRLSTVSYSESNPAPIDNFAHLTGNTIVADTVNWVRISGSFTADSSYSYLMLGSFFDDENTDTLSQNCVSCENWYSYYLIDDVCLSTDSSLCNGGIDAMPCVVSVEENYIENQFSFYPNPATDFVTIQNQFNFPFNIAVYNSIGKLLYSGQNVTTNNLQLDIGLYDKGLLLISIMSEQNQHIYKLLKQ